MLRWPNDDARANETTPGPAECAEARLVTQIAAGELRAFEQLYRAYHPRLTRFLERVTRRPSLVGELLNDTMWVVWKRADSYNGRSKVSTWIFAIAYRKALKAMGSIDEPIESVPADDSPQTATPNPEQQLAHRQLGAALRHVLGDLSVEQRAVVDLTYFHDIGYREIGAIVGCPVDTVKTRMFHARRRLRTLLAGRLEDWL